jgi:hypothetical protein
MINMLPQLIHVAKYCPDRLLSQYCPHVTSITMTKLIRGGNENADILFLQNVFNVSGSDHVALINSLRSDFAPPQAKDLVSQSQARILKRMLRQYKDLKAEADSDPYVDALWNHSIGNIISRCQDAENLRMLKTIKNQVQRVPLQLLEILQLRKKRDAVGNIAVQVVECRNLKAKNVFGTGSDVFVEVSLDGRKLQSTKVINNTVAPVWENAMFVFDLDEADLKCDSTALFIQVWDYDTVGRNDFLGQYTVPLRSLTAGEPVDAWYTLQKRSAKSHISGDIHLILLYEARIGSVDGSKDDDRTLPRGETLFEDVDLDQVFRATFSKFMGFVYADHNTEEQQKRMPLLATRLVVEFAIYYQINPFHLQLLLTDCIIDYSSQGKGYFGSVPFDALGLILKAVLDDEHVAYPITKRIFELGDEEHSFELKYRLEVVKKVSQFAVDSLLRCREFESGSALGYALVLIEFLADFPIVRSVDAEYGTPEVLVENIMEQMAEEWLEEIRTTVMAECPSTSTISKEETRKSLLAIEEEQLVKRLVCMMQHILEQYVRFYTDYAPYIADWANVLGPVARVFMTAVRDLVSGYFDYRSRTGVPEQHALQLIPILRALQERLSPWLPSDMMYDVNREFALDIDAWIRALSERMPELITALIASDASFQPIYMVGGEALISTSVVDLFSLVVQTYAAFCRLLPLPESEQAEVQGAFTLEEDSAPSPSDEVSLEVMWHKSVTTTLVECIKTYISSLCDSAVIMARLGKLSATLYVCLNDIDACIGKADEMLQSQHLASAPTSVRALYDSIIPKARAATTTVVREIVRGMRDRMIGPQLVSLLRLHVIAGPDEDDTVGKMKRFFRCAFSSNASQKVVDADRSDTVSTTSSSGGEFLIDSLFDILDGVLQPACDVLQGRVFKRLLYAVYDDGIMKTLQLLCVAVPPSALSERAIDNLQALSEPMRAYFVSESENSDDNGGSSGLSDKQFTAAFSQMQALYNFGKASTIVLAEMCKYIQIGVDIEAEPAIAMLMARAQLHKDKVAKKAMQDIARKVPEEWITKVELKWVQPALLLMAKDAKK